MQAYYGSHNRQREHIGDLIPAVCERNEIAGRKLEPFFTKIPIRKSEVIESDNLNSIPLLGTLP